jgi:hypothetical protein
MNEDDLEQLLRRYRPVGAPATIGRRLVASRLTQWVPAAVSLAAAVLFYFLASTHRLAIEAQLPNVSPVELAETEHLLGKL